MSHDQQTPAPPNYNSTVDAIEALLISGRALHVKTLYSRLKKLGWGAYEGSVELAAADYPDRLQIRDSYVSLAAGRISKRSKFA